MGYWRAGFEVVGVDIARRPSYPFQFHQGDAIEFLVEHWQEFDVIHASPPCQFATAYRRRKGVAVDAVNLIPRTRTYLQSTGLPYVIENVEQARDHLHDPVRYCGSSFGLDIRRHRLFESSLPLVAPDCDHSWQTPRFPCATNRTNLRRTVEVGVYRIPLAIQQKAMGISWMTLKELSQAIPPAFTEHLGAQLLAQMQGGMAA